MYSGSSLTLGARLASRDRIDKVAKDVVDHYHSQIEPEGFKAQLVAVDREACALYKEALDRYLSPEYSAAIYTSSPNDKELLRRHQMEKAEQLRIARQVFQMPGENPKILIVTDMLLTGFDAPIEQVMYLDKPLRDHKLLQAIARTNRLYPGKEGGIIVDYLGIFKNLVNALNFEHEDIEGVAYDYDLLRQEFKCNLADLVNLFSSVERDGSREELMTCISILDHHETLQEFKTKLSHLRRLYETHAGPLCIRED